MKTKATLELDAYKILSDAVERGLKVEGLKRAFKYYDTRPTDEDLGIISLYAYDRVMLEISELLKEDN